MKKKFIPIIGTISAGKSTFLQGLLGTDVFETGPSTTTNFVCLIKNSEQIKFYHVIPEKENEDIKFTKEDAEINNEEKIKEEIKKINGKISENDITMDKIFYMLEIPIKNIKNDSLLEECLFMDIPGLNEKTGKYINIIFSLISLIDIKFEIIIFDATSISSDNIINIIKKLEKNNALKKTGNLFILNKIDLTKAIEGENGDEDEEGNEEENKTIIDFKKIFYKNFEDDKNENLIPINLSENIFIPMNSLLFLAQTKIKEDFSSLLIVEFFNYICLKNKGNMTSFNKYLNNKLKIITTHNNSINLNTKITKEEDEIIKKSVKNLNNIKKVIKLRDRETKDIIEKLYLLHKNKYDFYEDLEYYNKIQQVIKDIHINNINCNNLPINPLNKDNNIININQQEENSQEQINNILNVFENFINETFKKVDPYNELEDFKLALQNVREYIIGRRIRIAFIGNINVGKSTVLNCIIGQNILPTNSKECTYRGVIIRHKEEENFKLYKTKLITKGNGSDEYYYFEEDKIPVRSGIKDIKSYLNIKNKDNAIEDKDAYFVITGKLKIFKYINLDKDIISKIEFVDLPGRDKESSDFNKKDYCKKILRFSNCCIYINEPKTIDDEKSFNSIKEQYTKDKMKIFPKIRDNFMKSCIFLINKSDIIKNEKDKDKIKEKIFNNILKIDEHLKEEDNISFFSGKKFLEYLNIMNNYIIPLKNEPKKLFIKLYKEYYKNLHLGDFETFIFKKISSIEDNFEENEEEEEDEKEEDEKEEDKKEENKKEKEENKKEKEEDKKEKEEELNSLRDFTEKIKSELEKLESEKYKLFRIKDYDQIINRLYNLKKKFEKIDYSKEGDYSTFFKKIKNSIDNSNNLYNNNFSKSLADFFSFSDILFNKELDETKNEKTKSLDNLINIDKNNINDCFKQFRKKISESFGQGKNNIFQIIDSEIENLSNLKEAHYNIKDASEKVQNKINDECSKIKDDIKEGTSKLIKEIEKIEKIDEKYKNKNIDISSPEISTKIGLGQKMFTSLIASTSITIVGEISLAETIFGTTVSGIVGGPIGIAIGFAVGVVMSLTTLLIHSLRKEKNYKKGLMALRQKIEEFLNEAERYCLEDINILEIDFNKKLNLKIIAIQKSIINIDSEEWKNIRYTYFQQKNKIYQLIPGIELNNI